VAACKLTDGRVMACGGVAITELVTGGDYSTQMDPACTGKEVFVLNLAATRESSTWSRLADMPVALVNHKAVTLPDGRVLVIGGFVRSGTTYTDKGSTTCLIYSPSTNTWENGPALPFKEYGHDVVLLPDGRVLYYGGSQEVDAPRFAYVLNTGLTTWIPFANPTTPNYMAWGTMNLLPDGVIAHVGGTPNAYANGAANRGLEPFLPDLLLYDTQAALQAADFNGSYPWAGTAASSFAYFLNTNSTVNTHLDAVGGIAPYSAYTAVDALPTGMTLDPATGVLSGTPSVIFDANVRFTATDSTAPGAGGPLVTPQKPIHILVTDPDAPIWVTPSLPTANVQENYSFQLVAKDGTGAVLAGNYVVSPNSAFGLHTGLSVSNSGVISGVATQLGSRQVTFRVTNPSAPTKFADKTFTLLVQCNTQLTSATLPVATPGVAYNGQLTVSGGKTPYSFSIASGTLPSGLTLNTTTGAITGTPGSSPDKDVAMVFNVSDPNGCTGSASITLSVRNVAMTISPSSLTAIQGSIFSTTMNCSGGSGGYTWNIQGLPTEFNYNSALGTIASTNVTSPVGTYPLTVKVTDSTGANTTATVNLTIGAPNYSWRSGPQVNGVAWVGAPYSSPNPIPVARMWQRFMTNAGNSGSYNPSWGYMIGEPFHVYIDGAIRSTTPTLILGSGGGVSWVSELISATGSRAIFRIHPEYDTNLNPNYPLAWLTNLTDFTIAATLNDGGSTSSATLKVFVEPTNGPSMPPTEAVLDLNGTAPPATYSDYRSRQAGQGGVVV
jgi:hypothetical protein